jgi:hypothetical protein
MDNENVLVGYETGPELGSDLLDYILKKADDNRVYKRDSNTVYFKMTLHHIDAPASMHFFSAWHARMAYLADRQATLEESYVFWTRLNSDTCNVVNRFMNDHALNNDVLSIDLHMAYKGPELGADITCVTFIWHWRHPEKKLKTDEFTF